MDKWSKGCKAHKPSLLLVSMLLASSAFSAEFFTIIGPDGRPMIVPAGVEKKSDVNEVYSSTDLANNKVVQTQPAQDTIKIPDVVRPNLESSTTVAVSLPSNVIKPQLTTDITKARQAEVGQKTGTLQSQQHVDSAKNDYSTTNQKAFNNVVVIDKKLDSVAVQRNANVSSPNQVSYKASPFTTIDGQQYVNNEYLENKEFNLDDKKRFYSLPEGVIDKNGGGVRLQTIERAKGVNRSFLDTVLKNTRQDVAPERALVLASTYYRLPKSQVEQTIEKTCFSGKKFKKPKELLRDDQLALFPKAPLQDIFDYELVKLPETVQDIKLTSFASSDSKPKFYWPFVVFLNEQGCVLEGAAGFKSEQLPATMLQHTAIQGLIKLPAQTRYLLMTPLATALDVDENALSNQGQITLTAIR